MNDIAGLPAGGFRLDGLTALISGGSRNIGASIALGYVQSGADVIIVGRDADRLEGVARQLREHGPGQKVLPIAADIGQRQDADRVIATALDACGTVHVLVNNAADIGLGPGVPTLETPILDVTDEAWDAVYATNILAPFRLVRGLAPAMLEAGGGSVINVLSGAGFSPVSGLCPYSSSKAALWMMTRALAVELSPTIRVNGLVPGTISEDGLARSPGQVHMLETAIPFRRLGRPEELVGAAVYLASPAASYTSGTLLFCNGARLW